MTSMSYCKFRNTLEEVENIEDSIGDVLDREEHVARRWLIKKFASMLENVGVTINKEELKEAIAGLSYSEDGE